MSSLISLSDKQTEAWYKLTDRTTTEILYGGAAGGGKSYLGCIWHITQRTTYPMSRGLIGRKVLKSIKESTLITYFKVCRLMGYKAGIDFTFNAQDMSITWSNGSYTLFKELKQEPSNPNFESLGSTEFTDVFIDEAGEITEKAFDIVNSRIRWMLSDYALCPKILLTCNPNINWIKHKYIKNQEGQFMDLKPYQAFISARVDDNPDEAFKSIYKQSLEKLSPYDKARLLFGDWDAIPKTGGEFYKQFDSKKHVTSLEYNPNLPLHISFDENTQPYFPCGVFQLDGKKIYLIDEILGRHPNNTVKYVTNEFKRKYPNHTAGLFIYGDATSQKDDVKQEDGHDLFDLIIKNLSEYRPTKRVSTSNPSVVMRGRFINSILDGSAQGISYLINDKCHESIMDYEQTKEAADGRKDKKTERDPKTGVSYQPHGHITDLADYLICYAFRKEFDEYQRGKKPVSGVTMGANPLNTRHAY